MLPMTSSGFMLATYIIYFCCYAIRYDRVIEFTTDCKAVCGQLNAAHVIKNRIYKKKILKQTKASTYLVRSGSVKAVKKEPERLETDTF